MVKKRDTGVEILLKDLIETDLGSLLRTYNDLNLIKKELLNNMDMLTEKIKLQLKERQWDSYIDTESKVSVTLTTSSKEKVNRKTLRMLLNDEQYNQIITKSSDKTLLIVNPQDREGLKKYGKK